ncbi:MAG: hypothetical protein AAB874_02580 [Patescibacteria group bacterium]
MAIVTIGGGLGFYKLTRLTFLGDTGNVAQIKQLLLKIIVTFILSLGIFTFLSKRKDRVLKLYTLVGGIVGAFFIGEIYFRIFNPQVFKNEQEQLFQYHSVYGWDFIPKGSANVVSLGEYKNPIKLNIYGLRDKEFNLVKTRGTKRIAVLGDSVVASLQVPQEDVFTERLESNLKNTEVINFGIPGFGPTQEYLQLQNEVFSYSPDLVVIVLSTGTDFDDLLGTYDWNFGYQRPRALVENGNRLKITNIPVPLPHQELRKRYTYLPASHLFQFISNRLYEKYSLLNLHITYETRFFAKHPSDEVQQSYKLLEIILRVMKEECEKNGVKLIAVIAPTLVQVYDHIYWPLISKQYQLDENLYNSLEPNQVMTNILKSLVIPYLDITSGLKEKALIGESLYFYKDRHFNIRGQEVTSELLLPFVNSHLLNVMN